MNLINQNQRTKSAAAALIFSLLLTAIFPCLAQTRVSPEPEAIKNSLTGAPQTNAAKTGVTESFSVGRTFRVEKFRLAGGSEIITIFADFNGAGEVPAENLENVPLVSVLRDTLGDRISENDRLRYVWMHSYAKPSFIQQAASGVPFLYRRVGNKNDAGSKPPPPVMDLNPSDKNMWDKVFWMVFKNLVLSDVNTLVRASTLQFRDNRANYRKSAMMRALAVLALYESLEGEKILSETELQDIQARVVLSDKLTGSFLGKENLDRVYRKNFEGTRYNRGLNWELLRQYSEAQGLYFDPLEMPDGSATHALVWVAEDDLKKSGDKKFDSRFLNIKNPWKDSRLKNWKGYRVTRWYDAENREVGPETPNARPKTLIPLALYGLDFPKIPTILVDFRDSRNPKFREISRRVLDDVARNVLSVSKFGNLPYFSGRFFYDFVTARRGIDINQSSRFRSYSQLKLLLLLNESLDEDLKREVADRLEKVSANPLENDLETEVVIARRQYENLIAYARRADGLPKKIEKDRREEMVRLKHGGKTRMLYALAHLFSFGIYTHREEATPALVAEMDLRRQLDFHERFLREVARDSARPEIDSDIESVRKSLAFMSEHGAPAGGKTARAVSRIFLISDDPETRTLALSGLDRIENKTAKKELLALYENKSLKAEWRNVCADYLQLDPVGEDRVSSTGAR